MTNPVAPVLHGLAQHRVRIFRESFFRVLDGSFDMSQDKGQRLSGFKSKRPGKPAQDTEQAEAYRIARTRLREAEEKVEIVKRWATMFQHLGIDHNHTSFIDHTGRPMPILPFGTPIPELL